jgi:hypothetical protein
MDDGDSPPTFETHKQLEKKARDKFRQCQQTHKWLESMHPDGSNTTESARIDTEEAKKELDELLEEHRSEAPLDVQLESKQKWRAGLLESRNKVMQELEREHELQELHRLKAEKVQSRADDFQAKLDQADTEVKALQRALGTSGQAEPSRSQAKPAGDAGKPADLSPDEWETAIASAIAAARAGKAAQSTQYANEQAIARARQATEAIEARTAAERAAKSQAAQAKLFMEQASTALADAKKREKSDPEVIKIAESTLEEAIADLKQKEEAAAVWDKAAKPGTSRTSPY